MSDDEFYYDDDDDWYWYEDDNMGLGDELAENAIHSPIMVEDPSLETVDTYSDWEYYSDDYYDDDPTVTTKQETNGERRKKRRKLSSIENIPSLSLGSSIIDPSTSMADSFKGVLWKVPVKGDEKIELYEPGKGEKVALLSDWRELFNAPLYREAWFTNGSKAAGNETDNDDRNGLSIDRAKATSTDTKYGRYSPPPLAIDNLDKTISRQREKLSQPELQNAPEQLPAEMMIVADSEEEDEELDETILDPMAVTEVDTAEDDKENNVVSEKEEQFPRQMSIRVEIPTLAAAMKQDALNQSTTPRKRGRKSKASFASAEQGSTSGNSATKQTPTTTKRKRVLTTDKEEQEEEDSKRRSKRVATSTSKKATGDGEPDKKNTRASSMASPREERRKRRRI